MKATSLIKSAALITVLVFCHWASADVIPVNDWYAINTTNTAYITNGDTISPDYMGINSTNTLMMFSYFDQTTLSNGMKMTLSFDFSMDLDASSADFRRVQVGLYNSSVPHATTNSYGADRVLGANGTINAWSGFLLERPADTNKNVTLYRKTGGAGVAFNATSDTDLTTVVSNTKGIPMTFGDNISLPFSFVLERIADDLQFSGSLAGTNFTNMTLTNAFSGGTYDVFDAFGFYLQAETGNTVTMNSAQFSNVSMNIVPEPSTVALLLVALAAAGMTLRRRIPSKP